MPDPTFGVAIRCHPRHQSSHAPSSTSVQWEISAGINMRPVFNIKWLQAALCNTSERLRCLLMHHRRLPTRSLHSRGTLSTRAPANVESSHTICARLVRECGDPRWALLCLFVCQRVCPSVRLYKSTCVHARLVACPSVRPSVRPSVYLSVCRSTQQKDTPRTLLSGHRHFAVLDFSRVIIQGGPRAEPPPYALPKAVSYPVGPAALCPT